MYINKWIRITISLLCVILSIYAINHLRKKRKVAKFKEQWYFIYLYIIYLIMGIVEIPMFYYDISTEIYEYFAYISFYFVAGALSAAGLSLNRRFLFANIAIIYGIVLSLIWISLIFTIGFEGSSQILEDNILSMWLNIPFAGINALILFIYTLKTRMSPIIGLLLASGVLYVFAMISARSLFIGELRNLARMIMLIFMILGFKGYFGFWELSREEKIKRGMHVRVIDEDEEIV